MRIEELRDRLQRRASALVDPVVRRLARSGITPDSVTCAGLALAAVAAACLAAGMLRTAGVVWFVGSALDMLDGALARHTGTVNRGGAFLDSSLDRIGEGLLLTAAVYHFSGEGMTLAAAVSTWALLASLMVSYTRARAEGLGAACRTGLATRAERVILLGLGLVFELLAAAVAVLAVLATITTVQRLLHVRAALAVDERDNAESGK
ncbi:MAG: CDP-alcohol phosphatidyltransferase family protein [Gammaproteobacteria bacterium]|nr:CDP-alcohol phosphatidyltransferase family protein [Gammaproteobacteria bacterium]